LSVVLLDVDPQASATNWSDRRQGNDLAVLSIQAARLSQTLDAARDGGADMVIIDSAGHNDAGSVAAARVSDLVLIPTEATMKAMETLPKAREIVTLAGSPPAFVVLNKVLPQSSRAAEDIKDGMQALYGLESCPVHFTLRAAYNHADLSGQTPQELDPTGHAAAEANDLYLFTTKQESRTNGAKKRIA
jgi:chromosome partitioning protein